MSLVLGRSDAKVAFERKWAKFYPALLKYGERSRKKALQKHMESMVETGTYDKLIYFCQSSNWFYVLFCCRWYFKTGHSTQNIVQKHDEEDQVIHAFHLILYVRLTIILLFSGSTDGDQDPRDPLCYFYEEFEVTFDLCWTLGLCKKRSSSIISLQLNERPEAICEQAPLRTSLRIAAFIGDEAIQYFVLVERKVLCQVPSFQQALFVAFCSFYVFHLEYPKEVKNVCFFLQDYVLGLPDSLKRPGTYLGVASDVKKHVSSQWHLLIWLPVTYFFFAFGYSWLGAFRVAWLRLSFIHTYMYSYVCLSCFSFLDVRGQEHYSIIIIAACSFITQTSLGFFYCGFEVQYHFLEEITILLVPLNVRMHTVDLSLWRENDSCKTTGYIIVGLIKL